MSRHAREVSSSSIYHVYNRGEGQQIIVENDADRAYFMSKVDEFACNNKCALLAWCLMDNHYHLLLRADHKQLVTFMHVLQTTYAGYFNRVHAHVGSVFSGRYKSKPVETDEYLISIVRYIHQNPVKASIPGGLLYRWSSYNEYMGTEKHIDSKLVMGLFGGREQFCKYHQKLGEDILDANFATHNKKSLTDEEAQKTAARVLGTETALMLKAEKREKRNQLLAALKRAGLSVRQIQRLTGISLGVIAAAGK